MLESTVIVAYLLLYGTTTWVLLAQGAKDVMIWVIMDGGR